MIDHLWPFMCSCSSAIGAHFRVYQPRTKPCCMHVQVKQLGALSAPLFERNMLSQQHMHVHRAWSSSLRPSPFAFSHELGSTTVCDSVVV